MKTIIYHNPRCSKSRQALQLLIDNHLDPEVIEYLKSPPHFKQLSDLIKLLGIRPFELIRKNEPIYKSLQLSDQSDDRTLIEAMITNPILIERPIVIINHKAVIARPPEKLL